MAGVSPEVLARRFDKWADQGLNYALVVGAKAAMERDRAESVARVRSKTGLLASTIRLTEPTAGLTARRGFFRISLAAGSKSKNKPVPYAGVLQEGRTFGGATRTKAHWIPKQPLAGRIFGAIRNLTGLDPGGYGVKLPGGAVRTAVFHPGSRLVARPYLKINETRAAGSIDASITRSSKAEL